MISTIRSASLMLLGVLWFGWVAVWGLVLLWLGRRHPAVYDPAHVGRRPPASWAWLALAVFLLCFTLAPLSDGGCRSAMKITATIITLNEERNIARAIESLRCCDEILMVDSGSADRTVELAEKLGVRVIEAAGAATRGRRTGRPSRRRTTGFFRSTPMKR